MPASVHGSLTLDGAPLAGVEVVLTDASGAALAAQEADATGGFHFAPAGGFTGGWVVARLHAPIVGAAARAVDPGGTADLALTSKAAATLSLTITPPAGVPLDWAIVRLSPRGLPGVPDAVVRAAQLVGVGPSIRGSYHEVRVTGPRLDVPLMPGTWGIGVEHIVERSPTDDEPPPDWINDTVVLADGPRVPAAAGAGESRVEISGDTAATVTTRRYDDGVPHGAR